jgi:serine/threonine protein kinase
MPVSAGSKLGPYELLAPLGAGGMGEVYRAKDARLGRDVALKVLPTDVARDADRRSRFEQEARAASAPTDGGEPKAVPGIEPEEVLVRWTADGRGLAFITANGVVLVDTKLPRIARGRDAAGRGRVALAIPA